MRHDLKKRVSSGLSAWKPAAVRVTRGEANLGTYRMTEQSRRQFCRSCVGHVLTRHPPWDLIDVCAAALPALAFEPKVPARRLPSSRG